MAVFKKIILLTIGMLLMLGGLQGCEKADESQDLSITQAVISKIKADAQIPDEMFSVETKKGKVTLTGSVDTVDQEKQLVSIAQSVQDVKSVESHLVVKDGSVVKEQIPVPAPQSSTPSNQKAEKPEAQGNAQDASPAGPTDQPQQQDKNKALPQTDMQSSSVMTQPPSNIEDVAVTARVKSLLMADPAYQDVTIETQSGIVSLTGTVDSQSDMEAMVKKVEAIEGVKKVNSQVTIKLGGPKL
jgi:hyperosmotically inducible protein